MLKLMYIFFKTEKNALQKTYNYKHRWKNILNVVNTCNREIIFPELQTKGDTDKK